MILFGIEPIRVAKAGALPQEPMAIRVYKNRYSPAPTLGCVIGTLLTADLRMVWDSQGTSGYQDLLEEDQP